MKTKYSIWIFASMFLLSFWIYHDIFRLTFFNDEWEVLGKVMAHGILAGIEDIPWWRLLLGQGRILGSFINNTFYYFFHDTVFPFALFSILIHPINATFVAIIAYKLSQRWSVAIISAVLFTSLAVSQQAVLWPAATVQTLGQVFLCLLSLYFGLCLKKRKSLFAIVGMVVSFYTAFLLKDSSLAIIFVLLILPFLQTNGSIHFRKIPWYFIVFCGIGGMVVLFKTATYFQLTSWSQVTNPEQIGSFMRIIVNCIFYPFVTLGHIIIPFDFMMKLSKSVEWYYSFLFFEPYTDFMRESLAVMVFTDMISIVISLLFVLGIFYTYIRNKKQRAVLVIGVTYYIVSFFPVALFLIGRNISYIESRYIYFSMPGIVIVIAVMLETIYSDIRKRLQRMKGNYWVKKIIPLGLYIIFVVFIYKQGIVTQRTLIVLVEKGSLIRSTLDQFSLLLPYPPEKPIFYVTGDSYYYFGIHVPFQLGPGFMLMLNYYDTGFVPSSFIADSSKTSYPYPFLYKYFDQGYDEVGGKGFGYFWDIEKLKEFYKTNSAIDINQIVGFFYNGGEKKLINITHDIRKELKNIR